MKKVLLLSPVEGRDQTGGDLTYTQILRDNPAPGIEYETYDRAMERGTLRERGNWRSLKAGIQRARGLALGQALSLLAREASTTAVGKTLWALKVRKLLFWEPFLFFEVRPHEYDLIHSHIFSARFDGLDCPLVISVGGRLRQLYLDARGFAPTRVKRLEQLDRAIARVLGVNATSEYLPQASRLYCITKSGSEEFKSNGILPPDRIDYIPLYLPTPALDFSKRSERPRRVGFIAREFKPKGGPLVLKAWDEVLKSRPDAELLIAGNPPPPEAEALKAKNVTWIPFIPRNQLLGEIMPTLDLFVYPTTYDYLPCFTILEVMARGVPILGSTHPDMDVALGLDAASVQRGEPIAGAMSSGKDASVLAQNILRMLEPDQNHRLRQSARSRFERVFSREVVGPQMAQCYQKAIDER